MFKKLIWLGKLERVECEETSYKWKLIKRKCGCIAGADEEEAKRGITEANIYDHCPTHHQELLEKFVMKRLIGD